MPIYEYRCDTCNDTFETVQRMGATRALHTDCGEYTSQKLVSLPARAQFPGPQDFAPPMPFQPFTEPQVTRDWMEKDGTIRPMKKDEWTRGNVPGLDT